MKTVIRYESLKGTHGTPCQLSVLIMTKTFNLNSHSQFRSEHKKLKKSYLKLYKFIHL